MAGHTRGPWNLFCKNGVISVFAEDGDVVAWPGFDDSNRTLTEHEANARLVAAAPELLEALAGMVSLVDAHGWGEGPRLQEARRVLSIFGR